MTKVSSRTLSILLPGIALSIISAIYIGWTYSDVLAGYSGDNAVYLLTAQYFSPFTEYSSAAQYFAQHSHYPPLYSFILGIFGGGTNLIVSHVVTTLFLCFALYVLFLWQQQQQHGLLFSLLFVVEFSILPANYMNALLIHSENLYLLLSLSSILFVGFHTKNGEQRWLWYAAVAIALSILSRSIGITLIAAFGVYLWLTPARNKLLLLATAITPFVLWKLTATNYSVSYIDHFYNHYSTATPHSLFTNLIHEAQALQTAFQNSFTASHIFAPLILFFGVCCLAGIVYRLYEKHFDAYYLVIYLGLIFIWPFPAEAKRLLLVILPVFLYQGIYICYSVPLKFKNFQHINAIPITITLILICISLPDLAFNAKRYFSPDYSQHKSHKHLTYWYDPNINHAKLQIKYTRKFINEILLIKDMGEINSCIYSIKPSIVSFYSNVISIAPPLEKVSQQSFFEQIEKDTCQYFLMSPFTSPTYKSVLYPFNRIKNNSKALQVSYFDETRKETIFSIFSRLTHTNPTSAP